jgi:hypothetical protein
VTWEIAMNTPAAPEQTIHGFLFAKLAAIGSKSETPVYFLQKLDNSELHVVMDPAPFHDEPRLRPHLGTKVTIVGAANGNTFHASAISRCAPSTHGCELNWGA